jgi:hypothetical protein
MAAQLTAEITLEDEGRESPCEPGENWEHQKWAVTLRYDGREMVTPFYTGMLHGEPKASDVLESLLSDAGGYANADSFEDWASDYGYDPDSRMHERTYKAVGEQTDKLRHLLGGDFDSLVFPDDDYPTVIARITSPSVSAELDC